MGETGKTQDGASVGHAWALMATPRESQGFELKSSVIGVAVARARYLETEHRIGWSALAQHVAQRGIT